MESPLGLALAFDMLDPHDDTSLSWELLPKKLSGEKGPDEADGTGRLKSKAREAWNPSPGEPKV